LASISDQLGRRLLSLINYDNFAFTNELDDNYDTKVEKEEEEELQRSNVKNTVKEQLILARLGQGQFKTSVAKIEKKCRVTGWAIKDFSSPAISNLGRIRIITSGSTDTTDFYYHPT